MSATRQPRWKHDQIFPIIARFIREKYGNDGRPVVARDIAAHLLEETSARTIIEGVHQQQQDWSLEHIASNMVAWFTARFKSGTSPYLHEFEHSTVDGRDAYKPKVTP
jgi:hypothetical protein